jgi:AcrR family transcriptional regulator
MYAATACSTCASLRAAAVRLAGERGIEGLSIATLSGAAGLTPGEAMDHYPDSGSCLYEAYDELSYKLQVEAAEEFESTPDWHEALDNVVSRMLRRLAQNPCETRLMFVEALRGDRELRRRRELGRQRMVALFLAEHHRRGDESDLSQIQLEMLLGASFHLIAGHVAAGRAGDLTELAPELAELRWMFEGLAAAA